MSQEKRALNPVRIVVMEVLVYDMCGRGGRGGDGGAVTCHNFKTLAVFEKEIV